jgi:hypothetical protein
MLSVNRKWLLQLRVLRFSFFQDWNVGVGVFPEGEEVFVGGAGLGSVALQRVRTGQAEAGSSQIQHDRTNTRGLRCDEWRQRACCRVSASFAASDASDASSLEKSAVVFATT